MAEIKVPVSAFDLPFVDQRGSAVWLLDAEGGLTLCNSEGVLDVIDTTLLGRVVDIAACGGSGLWILTQSGYGTQRLFRWRHGEIDAFPSSFLRGANRIAGARNSGMWLLGGDSLRYVHEDGSEPVSVPVELPVQAFHEAPNGTLWVVGGMRRLGGFEIICRAPGDTDWFRLPSPAAAISICGAPDGTAWSVNAQGDVWRLHPRGGGHFSECQVFTGCANCLFSPQARHAREVSVNSDGSVFILSRRSAAKGYAVEWICDFARKELRMLSDALGAVRIVATRRTPQ